MITLPIAGSHPLNDPMPAGPGPGYGR
jgi:hypothetical protein